MMLEVKALSKRLPDGRPLLKGISFDVREGELVGIIGLSGVGKTVLLRCINRLTEPDGGEICLRCDGEEYRITGINGHKLRDIRRKFAMVYQDFNLVGRLTVLDNVLIGRLGRISTLKSMIKRFSLADKEEALEWLSRLGIENLAPRRAETLSGGEMQRVALARAMMQGCQVLLADEPVANLDPKTAEEVMGQLVEITEKNNLRTLAVMHQPELVRRYCHRVIAIKEGIVAYDGKADIDEQVLAHVYDKASGASKVA